MPVHKDIQAYNAAQSAGDKRICAALAKAIDRHLPDAECKIWHAHPVWFLDGNPMVGYSNLRDCIRLASAKAFNSSPPQVDRGMISHVIDAGFSLISDSLSAPANDSQFDRFSPASSAAAGTEHLPSF